MIGSTAAYGTTGGTYSNNVAVGMGSGYNLSTGNCNALIGLGSGNNITTGNYNTALGYSAGYDISTQTYNTLVGYCAGKTTSATLDRATILGAFASTDLSGTISKSVIIPTF